MQQNPWSERSRPLCRDLLFNHQPLPGSITSRPCSTLTVTGASVLNPTYASQLPFRCRLGPLK
ncbi:hypothetical protein [Enterobacter cancerogenus]|uniref:hypothetical protein n=1 Tax=Enterobacter cancerogenus TaxID=69218 RepID=UPI001C7D3F2F|nr:hypothetical protein [Enterobacter cancerogenus]